MQALTGVEVEVEEFAGGEPRWKSPIEGIVKPSVGRSTGETNALSMSVVADGLLKDGIQVLHANQAFC